MKFGNKKIILIALVGGGVLSAGFGALIYMTYDKISEEKKTIVAKKAEIDGAKSKVSQIPALEKKVIILREIVKDYLRILPDSKEVNNFVRKIYGFQDETGVQITELQDITTKGPVNAKNADPGFEKVSYHLKLNGNTWEYLSFLNHLESYERFVRVPKLRVMAGDRKHDEDATKTKHEFDIDLETYVFNASTAAKPADIKNYEKRVSDLQDEISRVKDKIIAEPYDYHGARGRRDPFLDPRISVSGSQDGEEELRRQMEVVDGLRADLVKIGQMVLEHSQANQMIRRFELRRDIEQAIQALMEKVTRVEKEGKITYLPLVRRMQRDVIEALAEIRGKFDPKATADSGPTKEELTEIAKRIREHLAEGEFLMAADRYNLISDRLKSVENDPERKDLVADLRKLQREAAVAQEFGKKKIFVEGIIVSEQGSVVVINGRSFGEGDYLDDDLVVRKIRSDAIEFQYRDVVISKKI